MCTYKRAIAVFLILIAAPLMAALAVFNGVSYQHAFGLALFAQVVLLWVSELIPLAVTSLFIPCLIVLYGLESAKEAFKPFGSPIIFLFIGAFLLARAMHKHSWDKRMAYLILLSPLTRSSITGVALVISLIAFALSMWVTNTATCAMLCPLALGLIDCLKEEFEDEQRVAGVKVFILLLVAYSCSIGGIATPVGTPPNLITLGLLEQHNIHISFTGWVMMALPVAVSMYLLTFFYLRTKYAIGQTDRINISNFQEHLRKRLSALGPLKSSELQVAAAFALAVLLWVVPDLIGIMLPGSDLAASLKSHLAAAVVALIAAGILFCLPVGGERMNLEWEDARYVDWGTVLLFGGGLSLGAMLKDTGLAALLGEFSFGHVSANPLLLLLAACVIGVFVTELVSNTATASVLVVVLLGSAAGIDQPLMAAVLALCLGTSYAFMFPVATPPNAIVFGTGEIRLKDMLKTGFVINVVGIILLIVFFYLLGIHRLAV
ncbi:MAG: DASS family sodium-coupled anion symporter [Candidatus Dadabacteria bacterium]|nr:MAG: DASS family sodium-coupled anion symporter [Candidatus Dadabacteria bacterium]